MCINFNYRVSCGMNYFQRLQEILPLIRNRKDWLELRNGNPCLYTKLALIHPTILSRLRIKPPNYNANVSNMNCQAQRIWGYECSNNIEDVPENDHIFPKSLGGPDYNQNRSKLCKYHNQMKGFDVHLIPWEDPNLFEWIDNYLDAIWLRNR